MHHYHEHSFYTSTRVFFDTRSILISVTALTFGLIPTLITVVIATIVRLIIGGAGVLPGLAVIMTSSLIGLSWRRWSYPKLTKWRCLNVYLMSLVVHATMLACMLLLPYPNNLNTIYKIALPVMIIYPLASVLLSLLLIRQQELRYTQNQLKQSEERFKLLFDKAPLGYQSLDCDGKILDVNQQWCDLLGYSREEVVGKWFGDFLSPANKKVFSQRFPLFKEQGQFHSEFEVLHKSGMPLFISFEGKIGYGFEGEFKQTHCILQDITSQKAAETALAESERKYRNIAENISDVVWQTDLNLITTYISPSVEKLLGESPEEHLKKKLDEKFPARTLDMLLALLHEEVEREKDPSIERNRSQTIEVEHFKADGTLIWIEMNITIIRDTMGNAVGLLGVSRDITSRKLAESALQESEEKYSSYIENAPFGVFVVNDYGQYIEANTAAAGITGYDLVQLKQMTIKDITAEESLESAMRYFDELKGKGHMNAELKFIHGDGSIRWWSVNAVRLEDNRNLGFSRDITEKKNTEEALRESERSKTVLLSSLPGMAYRCNYDREWTMQFVSAGSLELTGYAPESLINNKDLSYNDLISPEYRDVLWAEWEQILPRRLPFRFEYEISTKNGSRKWVLELGEGVYDESGKVDALEGIVVDISDRKELERKLIYMNEHDSWTDLYNRIYLRSLLVHDGKNLKSTNRAILIINMSAINLISMNYGFNYGQELIRKISGGLKRLCRDNRQLFHIYENRFAFYVKEYKNKDELIAFCEEVENALELLLAVEKIGGGIGVVEINGNDQDIDRIFNNLMLASEKAINNVNRDFDYCFYNDEMEAQAIREHEIERELSHFVKNVDNGKLFMQFQPILDLKTYKVYGFEALARFDSDLYGRVSPSEFITLAEKTKLIIPLGHQIIIQSFQFLRTLKEKGYDAIKISINISVFQLFRYDFGKNLLTLMNEMLINPSDIELEVTESVFAASYQEINRILGELRSAGILIAIDDFGTEYSSLSRERDLNVDCLKIDQSFISRLMQLQDHEAITEDIISMAHKLGQYVIAEGVEYERQLEYLRMHGCDKVQGYLISKPLDVEKAIHLLQIEDSSYTSPA
ncbi:MAG: PAS domain S-box protein [Saccharofermentanales bacterium]